MDAAFDYVIENGGITTESQYPYKAKDQRCQKDWKPVWTIKDYHDVPSLDDGQMFAALVR